MTSSDDLPDDDADHPGLDPAVAGGDADVAGPADRPAAAADGDGDGGEGAAPPARPSGSRRRRRTPWYRRGNVWFAFVVVSAAGAWVLSGIAEDRLRSFDTVADAPEGVAWCDAAREAAGYGLFDRGEGPGAGEDASGWAEQGRTAHTALVDAAPGEVRADVEEVADAFATVVAAHPVLADPGSPALDEATADEVQDDVVAALDDHRKAMARLDRFNVAVCGYPLVLWPIETVDP